MNSGSNSKPVDIALFYPKLINIDSLLLKDNDTLIKSLVDKMYILTNKIYTPSKTHIVSSTEVAQKSTVCIFLSNGIFSITPHHNSPREFKHNKGDLLLLGENFLKTHTYILPELSIKLYEVKKEVLSDYLTIDYRLSIAKKIKDSLSYISSKPVWKQCPQKYMTLGKFLGKGSYGNVYSGTLAPSTDYAVKLSKLKPEATKAYSREISSWFEVFFLKDIIKPIIENKICPNLPLLIESLVCKKCTLTLSDEKITTPCITTIIEKANGNLKNYLKEAKPTIPELHSALFQIMAGLYAIQKYGQIMNFDVKKENILFYNIKPGGYWVYNIYEKNYYIPNYGKIFILNDFGISRIMSPKYPLYKNPEEKTFRLGSRFAIYKEGKFIPLNVKKDKGPIEYSKITWENEIKSVGAEFLMNKEDNNVIPVNIKLTKDMKEYLTSQDIPLDPTSYRFFTNPEIIPPFEFYNDTQDAIRMFIGGKRTTQKGNHSKYKTVPKNFIKQLSLYLGPGESLKDKILPTDPTKVMAGRFIESFFRDTFREKPDGPFIEEYTI